MRKCTTLFLLLCLSYWLQAQIVTTTPTAIYDYSSVDVIFDAALSTGGLKDYQGTDVYAHTGVMIEGSSEWKGAPAWLDNSPKYKLTSLGNNKWKLTIGPSIRAYYGIPDNQKIVKLAFVFRNSNGSKEGKNNGADIFINVSSSSQSSALPQGVRAGINYINDNTVTLALYAPGKNNVAAIGEFNNWSATSHPMNRAGDYWWITLTNLEKGKEYAFQYLVDGSLRIADPYTDKVLDPWNDPYISASVYPNLKAYPTGKTTGIVSIFQTGQTPYKWNVTNFKAPSREKLVIYELHIRDFTPEHSYASTLAKIDYIQSLGVNAIQLMPINEFDGNNSWGYNPAFYFAVDKYYGTKDAFKAFVDECHRRGMAVIIDMVLNHSYGQSPFVQLYHNNTTYQVTPENPWYNVASPNTAYGWGYDFNHESVQTKALVDSINSYWLKEYKVDGYRFDFTKGFTNTPGDGWAYDQARINILTRMTNEIYKRKSDAIVIFEHLADNSEEKILSDNANIMLWGNMNHQYSEGIMGYNDNNKSDISNVLASNRGWSKPNLVGYMESHDEERIMYKSIMYGFDNSLSTSLKRAALSAAFYIPLPGPKMIWQFGELGYDYSINACTDGVTISNDCRVAEKPIRWDYADNTARKELYNVYSKLVTLKTQYPTFDTKDISYSLWTGKKSFVWRHSDMNAFLVGNFDNTEGTVTVTIPKVGTWYDALSGSPISISNTLYTISLKPGEYRLFVDKNIAAPKSVADVADMMLPSQSQISIQDNVIAYTGSDAVKSMKIYDLSGRLLNSNQNQSTISLLTIPTNATHIVVIESQNQIVKERFIKR